MIDDWRERGVKVPRGNHLSDNGPGGLSVEEIAIRFGVSHQAITHDLRSAFAKLRRSPVARELLEECKANSARLWRAHCKQLDAN